MTVTLITGDRVTVREGGAATVEPGRGREHITFVQAGDGDRLRVMPSDAGRLVAEGRLDERLFDVGYLIEEGFDDAHRERLPLLIEGKPEQVREVAAGPGAEVTRELRRTRMSAVAQNRSKNAGRLWSRMAESEKPKPSKPNAQGEAGAVSLAAGVEKVWLDEMLHVTLDQSVPQIGAPQAWQAGYDGDDVTVAVLDTGVDAAHPDLAGRVAGAQNFTSESSATDGHGHGTHVASTIAGSGAASGGAYTGVAPGATLLNGKVCNSRGGCATSRILAGMEWATGNGADVVNMSLGGRPTDGSDPLSQAVNRLTASTGTLFVIAAGNDGPEASTVSSPGSADAALTVAAVDKSGEIAGFSSRGPRFGDHAVKPDIAAPGVAIVAARAAGPPLGPPVGDHYTSLSGTSMATPHVAGAAAILAQRHPDWTAGRLKAGLMNAAEPLDGLGPFQTGAGLVDVPDAIVSTVTATPSVSFGLVRWPHEVPPATRPVTYRNDGDAPVTLDLAITARNHDGEPAPEGLFTLGASQVTVPANGTASVDVTMAPQARWSGTYGGRLTATGAGAGAAVQTALGVTLEAESYDLTVNLLDRNGQPPTAAHVWPVTFHVFDYSTGVSYSFRPHGDTLRLPAGNYGVQGYVTTPRPDVPDNRFQALDDVAELVRPDVRLTRDTVLTLDAREARKLDVTVDRQTARPRFMSISSGFKMPGGPLSSYFHSELGTKFVGTAFSNDVYIGSLGSSDKYVHIVQAGLDEPLIRLDVNGRHGFSVDVFHAEDVQVPRTPLLGTHRMDVVVGGTGTNRELSSVDARGKLVVLAIAPEQDRAVLLERVANARQAGARAVLLDRSPVNQPSLARDAVPALPILLAADPKRSLLIELANRGRASVTTHGIASSPYEYNLFLPTFGQVRQRPAYQLNDRELAAIDVSYRATVGPVRQSVRRGVFLGRSWAGWEGLQLTPKPIRRTEYYSPGPVEWHRVTYDGTGGPQRRTERAQYRAGSLMHETQFGAVIGPSFATRPLTPESDFFPRRPAWVFRESDTLDIEVPIFADTAPEHVMNPGGRTTGFTRLYRDGALIAENTAPGIAAVSVPAEEANYRLEVGATPNSGGPPQDPAELWEISTSVSASWTFRSAHTSEVAPLPLMAVRYEPELDDYNRAPAGRKFGFPVRVEHQLGSTNARVTALTVQASHDDGQTWQPVRLSRTGERQWRASVRNPAEGFVTLRASATDADGNTVQQTIERAYGVTRHDDDD